MIKYLNNNNNLQNSAKAELEREADIVRIERRSKKMKQITKKEVLKGLNQLVGIKFLQEKNGKYKYHPNYKKTLLKSSGNSKEEVLIDALSKAGYFTTSKSEREIQVVCNLLML